MEYIRETLERQRAALWLLMLGGRNETPPEERRETARPGDLRLSQESPAKQDGRQALPAEQGARESRRKDASRAHREQRAREEAAPADEGTEERPGKRDGDAPLRAPAAGRCWSRLCCAGAPGGGRRRWETRNWLAPELPPPPHPLPGGDIPRRRRTGRIRIIWAAGGDIRQRRCSGGDLADGRKRGSGGEGAVPGVPAGCQTV